MKRIAFGLCVLFSVIVAALSAGAGITSALPSSGGLFISIPNGTVTCADVVLPDDMGYFGRGQVEFMITMEPGVRDSWSDLSFHGVSTDENNSAVIPICFSSIGRPIGNCSKPFTITISSAELGTTKSWQGGACVSTFADMDTSVPASSGTGNGGSSTDDVASGLSNTDVFYMSFLAPKQYATSSETSAFTLMVQSYATMDIDLSVTPGPGMSINPPSTSVSTGPDDNYHEVEFNVSPISTGGRYIFSVTGTARNCGSGSLCSRTSSAEVDVSDIPSDLDGFSVSLFPENLNVRDLSPVTYRLTVTNMGESDEFELSGFVPDGASTDFSPSTITVPGGGSRTTTFTITPSEVSSFYELRFQAKSSDGDTKPTTAYLSTNEQLTDALRNMDAIAANGDSSITSASQSSVDGWYNTYSESAYGEGLNEYSDLQNQLSAARAAGSTVIPDPLPVNTTNGTIPNPPPVTDDGLDLFGKDLWMVLLILVIISGSAFAYTRFAGKSKKKENIDDGFDLSDGI